MNWLDNYFFGVLRELAGKSAPGDFLIIFFGNYFLYICLAVFVFFAWRAYRRNKNSLRLNVMALASALIARFGVAEVIRLFYHRLRPFLELNTSHVLTEYGPSFPSGHTIFMFALATATWYFNKKLASFLFAAGLLIGLARIAGGVHYPTDILGGIVLGMLSGALVAAALERLTK